MERVVVRVDAELLAEVDRPVASGVVESRSDAARVALGQLVDAYRGRSPQIVPALTGSAWSDAATVAMIAQEPW